MTEDIIEDMFDKHNMVYEKLDPEIPPLYSPDSQERGVSLS